jgi:superoxide dismutase, Cu-Zn family
MRIVFRPAGPVVFAAVAAACTGAPRETASPAASPSQPPALTQASPSPATAAPAAGGAGAELAPTQGNRAQGTVTFAPADGGLRMVVHIEGLTPGEHGFHLHEKPDCSAPDASSAGDHWNPTGEAHGAPDAPPHHAGDLGNITADASGVAHAERVVRGLGVDGAQSVLGRSAVVHASADDLKTQPSGNSGARLACGVVSSAARRDPGD